MSFDIFEIPIIDTHEHLPDENHRIQKEKDVLFLFLSHYASTDIANAGLARTIIANLRDSTIPIEARWTQLGPYWQKISNTTYAHVLKIAARDLYGINQINSETIADLADKVKAASKVGLYREVFNKANIKWAIVNDPDYLYDPNILYETPVPRPSDPPGLFKKVINARSLIYIRNKNQFTYLLDLLGYPTVHSFTDWLDLLESFFTKSSEVVAIKFPHGYDFSLATLKPTFYEAEQVFNHLFFSPYQEESINHQESQPLQDYLIHFVIQQAVKHNLPIQVHTGLLEGSYNNLQNANPLHLIPLLMEYKEARFVLFHGSYPWIREFIALGKMFPNVWLDLCWVWAISPQAGRILLSEIIETIPQNKVTAFGGDYLFIEGTYGHSVLARRNIQLVLENKIKEGWFGVDEAKQYAKSILYSNALELYKPIMY